MNESTPLPAMDQHSQWVATSLILQLLTKENYGEDELAKKISTNTDYTFDDIKYVIWILKGRNTIIRINGGLGINPLEQPLLQGAFTTYRNISGMYTKG